MAKPDEPPEESAEVRRSLDELGLTWLQLWEAIREGERARQSVTEYEPSTAGGLKSWIARVGALRQNLAARGWYSVNSYHIALVVNPRCTIGVAFMLGDEKTGQEPASEPGPRSRYPKGPRVHKFVSQNETLFSHTTDRADWLDDATYARLETWFLVTDRFVLPKERFTLNPGEQRKAYVRSELSLAGKQNGADTPAHIGKWLKRIPLPQSSFVVRPDSPPSADDDFWGLSEEL